MSNERVLPEPHRYAVCAPADVAIKSFYIRTFEEIFIILHPFIKTISINPEVFKPDTYPNKKEIFSCCEPLSWEQFLSISGIKSYSELDIGLRTRILGLKKQFSNEKTAEIISQTCKKHNLIAPNEGVFPELIFDNILNSIKNMGNEWIWKGDEFCTERKLEFIDDLVHNETAGAYGYNFFTHDNKILLTTHWDSHFSLLCSDRSTLERIVTDCNLEGFYCNNDTQIYWSTQSRKNVT